MKKFVEILGADLFEKVSKVEVRTPRQLNYAYVHYEHRINTYLRKRRTAAYWDWMERTKVERCDVCEENEWCEYHSYPEWAGATMGGG